MPDSADIPEPKAGLRGNTAKTKEIFSQGHPHFPNKCASCHLNADGKVHGIKGNNKAKNSKTIIIGNCNGCKISNNCLSRINGNESSKKDDRNSKEVIQERKETYIRKKWSIQRYLV